MSQALYQVLYVPYLTTSSPAPPRGLWWLLSWLFGQWWTHIWQCLYKSTVSPLLTLFLGNWDLKHNWCVTQTILPGAHGYRQELSSMIFFLVTNTSPKCKIKSQHTSATKHWNKCELSIHLRKITTNKWDKDCPARFSRFWVLGGQNSGCKTGWPSIAGRLRLGRFRHPTHLACTSLGHVWTKRGWPYAQPD